MTFFDAPTHGEWPAVMDWTVCQLISKLRTDISDLTKLLLKSCNAIRVIYVLISRLNV